MQSGTSILLAMNGAYNVFRDIEQMNGNTIKVTKLEGSKKFFDSKSLTVATVHKDSTYVCYGWNMDTFRQLTLGYPDYDSLEYTIKGVVFRDSVLNEPSREIILIFLDGTAAYYTGFASKLMRKEVSKHPIKPKRVMLSPLAKGDTVTCVSFVDPFIYVGTSFGLVYMYGITSEKSEFDVVPVHVHLASEKKTIFDRLRGFILEKPTHAIMPFTLEEIETSRERGSVIQIGIYNKCIYVVYESSIIFSNSEHKFFETIDLPGYTIIHAALGGDRLFCLCTRSNDKSVCIEEFDVSDVRNIERVRTVESNLLMNAKYIELTDKRMYVIGSKEVIATDLDIFEFNDRDLVTVDSDIVGYKLYPISEGGHNLVSDLKFMKTEGLFKGSELALATSEDIIIHRCGSSFIDSLLMGTGKLSRKNIIDIAENIALHNVDIGLARFDIKSIEHKIDEKVRTYNSFINYIIKSDLIKELENEDRKKLSKYKEMILATNRFVKLHEDMDELFENIYSALVYEKNEFKVTDDDKYLLEENEGQRVDENLSTILKLCSKPTYIEHIFKTISRVEPITEKKLRVISVILNGCLDSRIPELEPHSSWLSQMLVHICEHIKDGVKNINSIPSSGMSSIATTIGNKRTLTSSLEIRKEIIDIIVAVINLELDPFKLLEYCLELNPIPSFVSKLAKFTDNYDVFIKATYAQLNDINILEVLTGKTDYEINADKKEISTNQQSDKKIRIYPEMFYDLDIKSQLFGQGLLNDNLSDNINTSVPNLKPETQIANVKTLGLDELGGTQLANESHYPQWYHASEFAYAKTPGETLGKTNDNNSRNMTNIYTPNNNNNNNNINININIKKDDDNNNGVLNGQDNIEEDIISNPIFYTNLLNYLLEHEHNIRLINSREKGLVDAIILDEKMKDNSYLSIPVIRAVVDNKISSEQYFSAVKDIEFQDKENIQSLLMLLKSEDK